MSATKILTAAAGEIGMARGARLGGRKGRGLERKARGPLARRVGGYLLLRPVHGLPVAGRKSDAVHEVRCKFFIQRTAFGEVQNVKSSNKGSEAPAVV